LASDEVAEVSGDVAGALAITGIVASYGENEPVLHGIDLSAEPGQVTAIIGPNGSGKSSLLRALCGMMNRRAGTVILDGTDISRLRPRDLGRAGIRYVPQGNASFPGLSIRDNLRLAGWALKLDRESLNRAIAEAESLFGVLETKQKMLAGYLSGGEQRQLEFARTAMGRPKLILLDEPSAGLSPKMATEMYKAIQSLRRPDLIILLVDQNVPKAMEISDVVYEFGLGRVTRRLLPGDHDSRSIIKDWLQAR
jgi:branched-chain amino acid transport system ATP-binding protein